MSGTDSDEAGDWEVMNKILVQIGDGNTAAAGQTLVSYALGSCIGVCLYDKEIKIAGMVHAVLPAKKRRRGHGCRAAVSVCRPRHQTSDRPNVQLRGKEIPTDCKAGGRRADVSDHKL